LIQRNNLSGVNRFFTSVRRPPPARRRAQVAVNRVTTQPGVAATILGATRLGQLKDNLAALDFVIPPELRARLDAVSAPVTPFPYPFFGPGIQGGVGRD
jgi:aryl-alcohol dehydrogenase-like predicted oxidoreductase